MRQAMLGKTIFHKTIKLCAVSALFVMLWQEIIATAEEAGKSSSNANKLIYVANFGLASGVELDPDHQADTQKLIDLMANSLVKEFSKAGYQAKRLQPGEATPHQGLYLSGTFTEFDRGNRAKRALIGFGSGAAKIEVGVRITDLSKTDQETMYSASARKTSGKAPGAVVMPSLTPVKLILTKQSPERTVKKTAAKIVARLAGELG